MRVAVSNSFGFGGHNAVLVLRRWDAATVTGGAVADKSASTSAARTTGRRGGAAAAHRGNTCPSAPRTTARTRWCATCGSARTAATTSRSPPGSGSCSSPTRAVRRARGRTCARPTRSSSSTRRPTPTGWPRRADHRACATRCWSGSRDRRDAVALAVMDFTFLGGSMGSVVGEKFARAAELAVDRRLPLVSVAASGGARMQEGVLALMQMAKTVPPWTSCGRPAGPFVSVLAHPTTGGVAASFAALGDIVIAEPGALLSFSGPRVVQADDPREPARRLRPRRVELPPRPHRPDRAPAGAARHGGARGGPARGRHALPAAAARRRDRPGRAIGRALTGMRRRIGGVNPFRNGGGRCRTTPSGFASSADAVPRATPGMPSSSPATRTGPTRSTTSTACATTSSSCTATGPRPTIPRSWPGSARSGASRWRSSATRRGAT